MKKSISVIVSLLVFSFLLISCNSNEQPSAPLNSESKTLLKQSEHLQTSSILTSSYNINITGPKSILLSGSSIIITGTLKDKKNKVIANEQIGIEDGLGLFCSLTKTDKSGNISYKTKVLAKGAAIVVFIVKGERYPFIFQAASKKSGSVYYTNNLTISALSVKNISSRDFSVQTISPANKTYNQTLKKSKTLTIIKTTSNSLLKRITVFGGASFSVGFGAGGQTSLTVDNNGVGTISTSIGVALLRGHEDWIRSLAFCTVNAGGLLLASASQDRKVRIWRVRISL